MDFQEYLYKKKIDSEKFRKADPDQWMAWKQIFDQVHPDSFTAQKLYLINPLRHLYPFTEEAAPIAEKERPKKPVMKPKPAAQKAEGSESPSGEGGPKPKMARPKTGAKPKIPVKPKIPAKAGSEPEAKNTDDVQGVEKPQPKTARPKPKIPMKPKIPAKPPAEGEANKKEVAKDEEKPKAMKPRIKPRPVIKKPKNDEGNV